MNAFYPATRCDSDEGQLRRMIELELMRQMLVLIVVEVGKSHEHDASVTSTARKSNARLGKAWLSQISCQYTDRPAAVS